MEENETQQEYPSQDKNVLQENTAGEIPQETRNAVEKKLMVLKERLQDLSGRNRLLHFKPFKMSTLEITHPNIQSIYDFMVVNGKQMEFPIFQEDDEEDTASEPTDFTEYNNNQLGVKQPIKKVDKILYNLRSRAKTASEEQGISILYMSLGFLRWQESVGTDYSKAPLILIPVNIKRDGSGMSYKIRVVEEDILLNPSLDVKLRNDFRIALPDIPEFLITEDLRNYFTEVKDLISGSPGWDIIEEVAISVYNFQNLIIIADIEKQAKTFIGNHLIQALSLGKFDRETSIDLITEDQLDKRVAVEDTLQVLDADSSQQAAIEAAKSGVSLIIQGPPGTGKSQTIANIIAEFLGQNKKVLFVSQKSAALDVVHRRLKQVGLGEFCLEVHSHKRNKKDVIEELGKGLSVREQNLSVDISQDINELKHKRELLNQYVKALHKRQTEMDITPFEVLGILSSLENVYVLKYKIDHIDKVNKNLFGRRLAIIKNMTNFNNIIDKYDEFLWRGANFGDISIQEQEDIEQKLENLIDKLNIFRKRLIELARDYSIDAPDTLENASKFLRVARIFKPSILSIPIKDINERFVTDYPNVLRYVKKAFREDRKLLLKHSWKHRLPGFKHVLEDLNFAVAILKSEGNGAKDHNHNHNELEKRIIELSNVALEISVEYRNFASNFNLGESQDFVQDFYSLEINYLIRKFVRLSQSFDQLRRWVEYQKISLLAIDNGLSSFLDLAIDNKVPSSDWINVYRKRFYFILLDLILRNNPQLNNFQGDLHTKLVDEFRELDFRRIRLATEEIRYTLFSNRPDASWMKASSSEGTILRREMNKTRRIKPLRKIFREIPDLLLSMKPCLMMSPFTVSQLLDPALYTFDLVIFDEASQVPPEYAIGAFARAKRVVVAGDRQQLPPTRFFQAVEFDSGEDDESYDSFESILDECGAIGMRPMELNWHYRSRDESLIAFSNYHFYDNRLYTFPSPLFTKGRTAIEFIHVPDGIYKRGAGGRFNIIEAREVVKGIIEHFQTKPDQSLGVVAFSHAQKRVIEEQLDQTLKDWPDLRIHMKENNSEPFFIKNLEFVQGDERDNMFFSIGYGPDEAGKFLMNFGPLNKKGGERRLNVAVTRAKNSVRVYSSIHPEDIDLSRTKSRGAMLLRNYLELARDGLKAISANVDLDDDAEFDSPFEISVYDALVSRGLTLRKQIGVSGYKIDLAVVDEDQPGRFLLGIECDGAMYHSSATARDRDRLRQSVLENLGWQIHRIWSREWFNDSHSQVEKVLSIVEQIKMGERGKLIEEKLISNQIETSITETEIFTSSIFYDAQKPKGTFYYEETILPKKGYDVKGFYNSSNFTIIPLIKNVVDNEGPISTSAVKKRIASAWSIKRMGSKFNTVIDQIIRQATSMKEINEKDGFLYPIGNLEIKPRIPKPGAGKRKIEDVSIEEIAELAYICVAAAKSLSPDDLIKETGALLNIRATNITRERLVSGARLLKKQNRIIWLKDKIRLPK